MNNVYKAVSYYTKSIGHTNTHTEETPNVHYNVTTIIVKL